jgi:hypothetical protein
VIAVAVGSLAGGLVALVGPVGLLPIVTWVMATLVVLSWVC